MNYIIVQISIGYLGNCGTPWLFQLVMYCFGPFLFIVSDTVTYSVFVLLISIHNITQEEGRKDHKFCLVFFSLSTDHN